MSAFKKTIKPKLIGSIFATRFTKYVGGTWYRASGGSGPIQAGNRLCSGGEKTIFDCPLQRGRDDTTNCNHTHDQGVTCTQGEEKTYKHDQ